MIKGPWTLRIGDGENGAKGVGYIEGPHPKDYSWPREIAVVYGMEDFSDAATMITAAPDMLAALKECVGHDEARFMPGYASAKAAIAKAECR